MGWQSLRARSNDTMLFWDFLFDSNGRPRGPLVQLHVVGREETGLAAVLAKPPVVIGEFLFNMSEPVVMQGA